MNFEYFSVRAGALTFFSGEVGWVVDTFADDIVIGKLVSNTYYVTSNNKSKCFSIL